MQCLNNASNAIAYTASYLARPAAFVTGVNNLITAEKLLLDGKKKVTFIDSNNIIHSQKFNLPWSQRITGAAKELWTFAGKASVVATIVGGGVCRQAEHLGMLDASNSSPIRYIAERSFDVAAQTGSVALSTARTVVQTAAHQTTNHPKIAFAIAGTAASLYVGYQGCKDIAKLSTNLTEIVKLVPQDGSEEAEMIRERPRTLREKASLITSGVKKFAAAGVIAYGTYEALALSAMASSWMNSSQA
jgi:hypothetical protein